MPPCAKHWNIGMLEETDEGASHPYLNTLAASMKYPEGKMSIDASLPMSVQSWFGHELEIRGIDAVVYTRYIISVLQQDQVELDPVEVDADHLWGRKVELKKFRGRKHEKKKTLSITEEEKKKSAAVDCLLAISDEATDLEGLVHVVEELSIRLKECNAQKENQEPQVDFSNQGSTTEGSVTASTPEDPAERYYAAFPALQGQGGIAQVSPTLQCDTGVWKKIPITNQQAGASDEMPDDATDDCGLGESNEAKMDKSKPQKILASKSGHDNVVDLKKSTKGRSNNVRMPKSNQGRHGKSKRENKGFSRAARFLSWPQGNPGRQEKERNRKPCSSDVQSGKAKSASPTQLENHRNEKYYPGREISSSFSNNQEYYSSERQWRRNCGLSPVSPEFKEQESWYTQPLDGILSSTPDTKGRLFNRHSLSTSDQYSSGTPSPSESSPADSPNTTKEILLSRQLEQREDIWQVFEDDPQQLAGSVPDLKLPAFFLVAENLDNSYGGAEWSCLEQENLRFQNPEENLTLLIEGSVSLNDDGNSYEFDNQRKLFDACMFGEIGDGSYATSDCHLDTPSTQQISDLVDDDVEEGGLEPLKIFSIDLLPDEPCSQNSPSQYKAWGSLSTDTAESSLELSFQFPEFLSPMKTVEIDCFHLLPPFEEQPRPCTEDPDGSVQINTGTDGNSTDSCNTNNEDTLLYIGKDFGCFLSDESLSLFGDLLAKSWEVTEPADVWKTTDDLWQFTEPKKPGVFSAALFTDLISPLVKDEVFTFCNPWFEDYSLDEASMQTVWESHQLNCKPSPLSAITEPCEDYPLEDIHLQKVWDTQHFNYKPSSLNSTWLGTAVTDSSLSYIPLFSLWVEEEPASTVDDPREETTSSTSFMEQNPVRRLEQTGDLWKHAKSASLENITSTLWEFTGLESSTKLSKSFELVPSEHSAFEDVVPKKLLHVHSEPNLKYSETSASLLRTPVAGEPSLGVAACEESQEHLYFSPKTHFRPIQTPDQTSRAVTPDDEPELNLQDLFGGHLATSKTPYQPYVAEEIMEASFIPKFRVKKASGKYVQTGVGVEETSSSEDDLNDKESQGVEDDDKLGIIFEVLGNSEDSSEEGLVFGDLSDVALCESKLFKSDKANTSAGEDALEEWNLRSLWSTTSDIDTVLKDPQSACSSPYTAYGSSIWSTGVDTDIPPLPKLGTYDSEQSFYWTTTETPSDYENSLVCEADPKPGPEASPVHSALSDSPNVTEGEPEDGSFKLESHLLNWNELAPLPDQAVYSCELEQKWLSSDTETTTQLPSKDVKKRISRKPCSFFLEGHCRRSDCKFAHDMSTITCRFWEDGECFKGTTCPFLHGYPSDDTDSESSTSRKTSYEWNQGEFPDLSEQKGEPEKDVQKLGISKSTKKRSLLMKKAWSTYRNYRWANKSKKEKVEKAEKEAILRKN